METPSVGFGPFLDAPVEFVFVVFLYKLYAEGLLSFAVKITMRSKLYAYPAF